MQAILLVAATFLGQASTPANLDFAKASLEGWDGKGFAFVPAEGNRTAGAWSKDEGAGGRKGMVRFAFTVPTGARQITFQAYADIAGDNEPDQRLNVLLAGANNVPAPRVVKASNGSWTASNRILLPWLGKPRTYAWDVVALQGKLAQIVLVDQDERPGHFVWAGDFKIVSNQTAPDELHDSEFGPFMLDLQKKNNLSMMGRFDSRRFSAISNAGEKFTTERLQNCEVFYDLFLTHFKAKGFPVYAPAQRMMIAVFDTHEGFDAYFGQKMPSGIAGVYHPATNRLILYDYSENRALLANKDAALKKGASIANSLKKAKYVDTIERKLTDISKDANLSTTMHECAHQISFNCGLLTRMNDVPAAIAEGLATYCEATDHGDWTSLGGLNPMRIAGLQRANGRFIPIADLIRNEQWLQTQNVLLGYSQSWALFHFLIHERRTDLQKYLKIIETRRTPEHRLDDFQQAFGNIAQFDLQYQNYLTKMAKSRPPGGR
jgi:hypothetical protein